MSRLLKSGDLSEDAIHKAVIDWARLQPKYNKLILHFPNEGQRTPRYGKRLKDMGMRKGVSDLFIACPKHGYGGAWIELKSKNGILSKEQKQFLEDMQQQNYFTAVTRSLDEALEIINWYCFKKESGHQEMHNPQNFS